MLQVAVFSWTFCPFARKAKQLLTDLGADFTAIELDQREDGKAIRAELAKVSSLFLSMLWGLAYMGKALNALGIAIHSLCSHLCESAEATLICLFKGQLAFGCF